MTFQIVVQQNSVTEMDIGLKLQWFEHFTDNFLKISCSLSIYISLISLSVFMVQQKYFLHLIQRIIHLFHIPVCNAMIEALTSVVTECITQCM